MNLGVTLKKMFNLPLSRLYRIKYLKPTLTVINEMEFQSVFFFKLDLTQIVNLISSLKRYRTTFRSRVVVKRIRLTSRIRGTNGLECFELPFTLTLK